MWKFKILKQYRRKTFITQYVEFEGETYIIHKTLD